MLAAVDDWPAGHQVNMWLETMEQLDLLRVPTMKHVFIGHGDSDELASVNPYSKVYDEVWTAGRAGRDRYAIADVGVRDDDIVEVGRPQLAPIQAWQGAPEAADGHCPTVLYAPTWEVWDGNPGNTSIVLAGENIVRKLIAADPPVRVLYKPHPFTGTVSKEAGAAHRRITALVEKAAPSAPPIRASPPTRPPQATAESDLARIEARIDELTGKGDDSKGHEAEATRDSTGDVARHTEIARLRAEWNTSYWHAFPSYEHRVITGAEPRLYDCLDVSDAMVSDVSSASSCWTPYATRPPPADGRPQASERGPAHGPALFRSPYVQNCSRSLLPEATKRR